MKVHHVRRAMTIMTENRPFPRENKDNFMRGGGVHLEYCALGLSWTRSRYRCHNKKRQRKTHPIMRHAMISGILLNKKNKPCCSVTHRMWPIYWVQPPHHWARKLQEWGRPRSGCRRASPLGYQFPSTVRPCRYKTSQSWYRNQSARWRDKKLSAKFACKNIWW